jgi:hypothetical protein
MGFENFHDMRLGGSYDYKARTSGQLDPAGGETWDVSLMKGIMGALKTAWRVLHMDLVVDAVLPNYYAEIDKCSVAPLPLYVLAILIAKLSYQTLTEQLFFFLDEDTGFVCPSFGSVMRCGVLIDRTSTGITAMKALLALHYMVMIHGTRFSRLFLAVFHGLEYLCVNILIFFWMYTHVLTVAWREEVRAISRYARRVSSIPFFIYLILYPIQAMHASEFLRYLCEHLWEREMIREQRAARTPRGSPENYGGDERVKSSRIQFH